MIWDECISTKYYKDICCSENFTYLHGENVLHTQPREILWKYIEENVNNYKDLRAYPQKISVIQYINSAVFPYIYTTTENRGVYLKSEFQLKFKEWNDKKNSVAPGKDSTVYEKRIGINKFEQKPVEIDTLVDEEREANALKQRNEMCK